MEIILKVTPELLLAKVRQLQQYTDSLTQIMNSIDKAIEILNTTWEGEGADIFMTKYNIDYEHTCRLISLLNEYSTDLLGIADVYKKTEQHAVQCAISLKNDPIV